LDINIQPYHHIRGIYNALDNKDVAKGKQLIKAKEEEEFYA
jgi:hypothetical protein